MSRTQVPEGANIKRNIRPIAVSVVLGAAVTIVILLIMSLVISTVGVPQSLINPMAILAISVGGFVAGICCAKIMRERGLLYGALCGAVLTVILLLSSFAISDNGFGLLALIKAMFILFSAMIGGVLGVNQRRRRR